MNKDTRKKSKADVMLIAGLAVVGIFLILYLLLFSGSGKIVEIRVDGNVIKQLPLDTDTVYDINNEYGKNRIVIENGEAYMKEADCPDGLCKNMGKISRKGQSVICLPHRLVIEIKDEQVSSDDVDVIVK